MKVAVVTPTIGSDYLSQCIYSVDKQTYPDVTHYIFADGVDNFDKVAKQIEGATKVKKIALEENVGKGWYGHRVYAACSFLVNADVICYLDEDNWIEPEHIQKMVEKIQAGNDWVYSLRKIFDKDGQFICEDNCESLGKWPVYFNPDVYHIDTSCFAIRRDIAIHIGHTWYGQWGADRKFFYSLKQTFTNFDCTNDYTVCYRLDGNSNSVPKDFFQEGNEINRQKYNDNFPWKLKQKSINVGPGITILV
jgi:glycosyltransferase involved in cell wall biosynthesis